MEGDIRNKMNEKMKYCIDEIRKYSAGVHELKKGIRKEKIKLFEEKIGIVLPDDYMEFLTIYNGGEIFIPGTSIAGIYDEEQEEKEKFGNYLDDNLQKKWPDMGDKLLIVADLNYGDMICIDEENNVIVQWDHEKGEIVEEWDGFSSWLKEEMEIGKDLVDYNGEDK